MAKEREKKPTREDLALVSFKLGKEVYAELAKYAATQTDEAGIKLSPSQVARKLMLDALRRLQQKKS